jgi:PTH1 family peptidyl-tRNA hydrolase
LELKETPVRLIVGLGNPGDVYRRNRHNLGFLVVEELARRLGSAFQPGGPSYLVAVGGGWRERIILLKPLTYMNLSGQAVVAWSRDAGVAVTGKPQLSEAVRPLVVCDDLSLLLGSVRLRPRGSSGGQNGLASVIDHLEGEEFPRLRLGIAPLGLEIDPEAWSDHVLADFDQEERSAADDMVVHAATALEFWLAHDLETAISRFNRRVRPDPEQTG